MTETSGQHVELHVLIAETSGTMWLKNITHNELIGFFPVKGSGVSVHQKLSNTKSHDQFWSTCMYTFVRTYTYCKTRHVCSLALAHTAKCQIGLSALS